MEGTQPATPQGLLPPTPLGPEIERSKTNGTGGTGSVYTGGELFPWPLGAMLRIWQT